MCGISGSFSLDSRIAAPALRRAADQMVSCMVRRGPDDEGVWNSGPCIFGFRRLSILDLSPAGHQPMLTPDERYALVFNGEIYNFQELRRELQREGVALRSTGDTEVVLQLLARRGVDALRRLNGMFALAFYDVERRRLLLARDHAGIKPLYYVHTEEGLAFGSQYNQVVGHPWARNLAPDPAGVGLYLRFGYVPAPHALLRNTHLLDAGAWLSIEANGRVEMGHHYEFPRSTAPDLRGEQAIDALDEAFAGAVARQLVADVPVGVFLSGGIDSPLVAAEAARLHPGLQAFSIGVAGAPKLDELPDARLYAAELGLRHVTRQIDPDQGLALLDDVIAASTEPTADFSIFPTLMVSGLARQHVTVALSGDGGDELFWGYPSRFGSAIEQAPYFAYPRAVRAGLVGARTIGIGRATRESLAESIGRLYERKHLILLERDLHALFPALPALPRDFDLFDYDGTDPDETAAWVRWNEFRLHLARILLKVDRASMHHSLEVRVPLLDRAVIDVATRMDWRECLSLPDRVGKRPLRALLARRVKHHTRAKRGFTVPMHQWLAGPLRELVERKVASRDDFMGVRASPSTLRQLVERTSAGDGRAAWGLWQLLSLVLWEERHLRPAG